VGSAVRHGVENLYTSWGHDIAKRVSGTFLQSCGFNDYGGMTPEARRRKALEWFVHEEAPRRLL
jgi:hypothetical protein